MSYKSNCFSFASVEPLTRTGVWEEVIVGGFPKEVAPYKGLWIPFDEITWALLLVSFMIVALAIFVIEKVWSMAMNCGEMKYDGMLYMI